jgi:hypothetical protein
MMAFGRKIETQLPATASTTPVPVQQPARIVKMQEMLQSLIREQHALELKIMKLQQDCLWLERHPEATSIIDRLILLDVKPEQS